MGQTNKPNTPVLQYSGIQLLLELAPWDIELGVFYEAQTLPKDQKQREKRPGRFAAKKGPIFAWPFFATLACPLINRDNSWYFLAPWKS
jgi:hypothetical protein